jgi:hypothetical protein
MLTSFIKDTLPEIFQDYFLVSFSVLVYSIAFIVPLHFRIGFGLLFGSFLFQIPLSFIRQNGVTVVTVFVTLKSWTP